MNPDSSQYFSLKQLWVSLAIAGCIGGAALLLVYFYSSSGSQTDLPAPMATTTTVQPNEAAAVNAYENVRLSARSAIVLDLTSGQTLYSQNADTELPLASLTKLLSTYAAEKTLSSNTPIVVGTSSIEQEGESGIVAGESFALEDLAKLSLVGSSNDAADALTVAASARASSQQALLASAASGAGLGRTRAVNGTGLDVDLSTSGGYGTARDIAKLAGIFAREYPALARATTQPSVRVTSREGVVHELPNTNRFAHSMPGLMLSKTGFTDLAGGNLVVVYDAGINRPIAIAVLGSTREERFSDVQALVRATQRQLAAPTAPASSITPQP